MVLDVEKLLKAVDNDNNQSVLKLSKAGIKKDKNDILQKLGVKGHSLSRLHKQLKEYRYIDNLDSLNFGAYVRWIDIRDPDDVYITNGGHICEMLPSQDDIVIKCKNAYHRFFQFEFNKSLVFQKLSQQEKILLSAMECLK